MAGIASVISRLTPPPIVLGEVLPRFSRICWPAGLTQSREERLKDVPLPFGDQTIKAIGPSTKLETLSQKGRDRRAVFIGEQHQQPKALSAQLQLLYHILHDAGPSVQNVHVVFEQWSLEDQPLLDRLNGSGSAEHIGTQLRDAGENTSEGFGVDHYATLVKLVREMGGKVWAGFPPRSWARIVATGTVEGQDKARDITAAGKQALNEVQRLDQERYERTSKALEGDDVEARLIPPMPVQEYEKVTQVSWAHRTYLKGMFSPDQRPLIPAEASSQSPPAAQAGFAAAQALKDTFLAHAVSTLLARDKAHVVVAICGLGHCEWSFGAPERVRGAEPYVIITKPDDAGHWPALHDQTSKASVSGPEWDRKQADAVILYEWVD